MAESKKKKSKRCDTDSDDDDWMTVRPSDPVLIGVSHWGSLKRKRLLYGISVSDLLLCNGLVLGLVLCVGLHTVNRKKDGSTFVIITLESFDRLL